MYLPPSSIDKTVVLQGDIFNQYPFFIENSEDPNCSVMAISQTCDAQRRESIILAPIFSFSYMREKGLTEWKLNEVRGRKLNYWFYLPELSGVLGESLVDFQLIRYFSRETVEAYKTIKTVSLSDWGRHHLSWALSNFFGRPTNDPLPR